MKEKIRNWLEENSILYQAYLITTSNLFKII